MKKIIICCLFLSLSLLTGCSKVDEDNNNENEQVKIDPDCQTRADNIVSACNEQNLNNLSIISRL
jgi:hypothetical protein